MTLRDKTISGIFWTSIERFSVQAIRFIFAIVLARLLSPGDFGLVGMLTIFIAFSTVFIDSGFGHTLIQMQNVNNEDYSTIFYFNLIVAIVIYIILFFAAPFIAIFFKQPQLLLLSRVVFLNLIFTAFTIVQNTLVSKHLNFKVYTKISIVSYATAGIVSIIMAYYGYGVWSLVVQTLCNTILQAILLWVFNSWRPLFFFSYQSLKKVFVKSSSLLATGIISQIFDNLYYVIIGRVYSNVNLGYYTQAKKLQEMPTMTLNSVIQAVTFPALAQIQNENERLKKSYSKILQVFMFINIPLMIGLLVIAKPLVLAIFTAKWLPIIPYFYLFCITGILFPLGLINGNIMKVKGEFGLIFKLDFIKKVIMILLLLVSFKFGLYAIVVGQAIYIILGIILNVYFGSRLLLYKISDQIKEILPFLLLCLISILPSLFFLNYASNYPIFVLICQIISMAFIYLALAFIFKIPAFIEIISIVNQKILEKIR